MTPDVAAELDAAVDAIRAANPGITNGEVDPLLPEHLRGPFWERAVDRYLEAEFARLGMERP